MDVSRVRQAGCVAVMIAFLSACSSVRTVRPSSQPGTPGFGGARAGDHVSARLTDGRRVAFVVRTVEADSLVATTGDRYERNQIVEMKRREFSPAKTAILAAGIVGGAILLMVGAAMGSLMGGGM